MKTFILLATVCLLGVASAAPATTGLHKDFADFFALLPVDEIIAVSDKYADELEKVRQFYFTKEFAQIWDQLSGNQEFRNFVYYLNDAGLPVLEYLQNLAKVLGLPKFPAPRGWMKISAELYTDGLKEYYDEIIALLPKEKIQALYKEKMETSKEFAELYHKIASADFQQILKFVEHSPELSDVFQKLRSHGIDVDRVGDLIARIFGWKQ